MDPGLMTFTAIAAVIYYFGRGNMPVVQPQGPGPVVPPPQTIPLTPLQRPPVVPIKPLYPNNYAPLQGSCFGVADNALPPYYPNVKNNCKNNVYGWSLVPNPTLSQCKTYVGPEYLPALGGCIVPNNSSAGKTMFIVVNSGKPNK